MKTWTPWLIIGAAVLAGAALLPVKASEEPIRTAGIRMLYWGVPTDDGKFGERIEKCLSLDYVSGVDLYIPWRLFEPSEGQYDFRYFDEALVIAAGKKKSASISLLVAHYAPEWLKKRTPVIHIEHPHPDVGKIVTPVPWAAAYERSLSRAVGALARYDGNSNVYLVHINGPSSLFGVEFNWPMRKASLTPADAKALDFTLDKFRDAWQRMVDVYLSVFSRTLLAAALHCEIMAGDYSEEARMNAAREFRDYAIRQYAKRRNGGKIVLELLGLCHENAKFFPGPYRDASSVTPYVALVWEARHRARIGFESAKVWRWANERNPTGYDAAFFQNVLENGISYGAEFIKVKYPDIWDENANVPYAPYVSALRWAANQMRK